VVIDERAAGIEVKFIIAEISDGSVRKTILRSSTAEYHKDIYQQLERNVGGGYNITVLGGGRLVFDKTAKRITLFGSSTQFGRADGELAKKLLQSKYNDFKIEME